MGNPMSPSRPFLLLALAGLAALPALAQWSGSGDAALVLAESVVVFRSEKGDEPLHLLVKDEIVVAHGTGRRFRESGGRARVELVLRDGKRLRAVTGWVSRESGFLRFSYPCGCAQGCWPFEDGGREIRWNSCVQEAAIEAVRSSAAAP
jgi:hypothetical protein